MIVGSLTLSAGCSQPEVCSQLGACGGDIVGAWDYGSNVGESCEVDLYEPPSETQLINRPGQAARAPQPESSFYDWCSNLVVTSAAGDRVSGPSFTFESARYGSLRAEYRSGFPASYELQIIRTGTYYFNFSTSCMRQFGAVDGLAADPKFATTSPPGPLSLCQQLEPALQAAGNNDGAYFNVRCVVDQTDPGGCVCRYDLRNVVTESGTYLLHGSQVTHFPMGQSHLPNRALFCRTGDRLQLSGTDGSFLYDKPGLRSVVLVPAAAPSPPP